MLHHAGRGQPGVGSGLENAAARLGLPCFACFACTVVLLAYRFRPAALFMKRLPLPCPVLVALVALIASAGARAEWLTLTGSPGDAASSYVQVDPTTVQVDGSHRIVNLRLSLAQERTTKDGLRFRSFNARVNVDCEARNARYVSATYFGHPDFVGEPIAVRVFEADDVRPMTLSGAPRDLAGRTINAACSVSGKEQKEAAEQPVPDPSQAPQAPQAPRTP